MHIFVIFEAFEEFLDRFALLGSEFFVVVGDTFELRVDDFEAFIFEEFLDICELVESAIDHPFFSFGVSFGFSCIVHVVGFEVFEGSVGIRADVEHALMLEEERE